MTFDDVYRLLKYWSSYPPLRDLVAAFVGFEIPSSAPEAAPEKYMTADDFRRLMAMTGGKIPGL